MITKQIEAPKLKMLSHVIQVGAPEYPYGLSMEFEIECEHNIWTDAGQVIHGKMFPLWENEIKIQNKSYRMIMKESEVEEMFNLWRAGCVNYEEWLLDLKHKHEDFKVEFAEKEAAKIWAARRRWWQIFKSRKQTVKINA